MRGSPPRGGGAEKKEGGRGEGSVTVNFSRPPRPIRLARGGVGARKASVPRGAPAGGERGKRKRRAH